MSLPARDKSTEADVWLNRINVTLARSNALINSWLPPRPEPAAQPAQDENTDDFKSMTEVGGYGSKAAYEDDRSTEDGLALPRRKAASNDKLLEQILGKKGAQAKKAQAKLGKNISVPEHGAPKPLATRTKRAHRESVEGDDEDEGGRATAFASRRQKTVERGNTGGPQIQLEEEDADSNATPSANTSRPMGGGDRDLEPNARPSKRKKSSYLDEVLAQKSRKKNKNKQIGGGG